MEKVSIPGRIRKLLHFFDVNSFSVTLKVSSLLIELLAIKCDGLF
jgi:hypothetical protein